MRFRVRCYWLRNAVFVFSIMLVAVSLPGGRFGQPPPPNAARSSCLLLTGGVIAVSGLIALITTATYAGTAAQFFSCPDPNYPLLEDIRYPCSLRGPVCRNTTCINVDWRNSTRALEGHDISYWPLIYYGIIPSLLVFTVGLSVVISGVAIGMRQPDHPTAPSSTHA